MKKFKLWFLGVLICCLFVCSGCGGGGGNSSSSAPPLQVTIDRSMTEYSLLGDNFPTFLSHLFGKSFTTDEGTINLPFAEVTIKNDSDISGYDLRLEVSIPEYSIPSAEVFDIGPHQTRQINITPDLTEQALFSLNEEEACNIHLKVSDFQGRVLDEWDKPINLLSKNDMVHSIVQEGEELDFTPFVAVFVTPRSEKVKLTVAAAKNYSSLSKEFMGYQEYGSYSHQTIVYEQLKALYDYLAAQGITYVNSPVSFHDDYQSIRYPSEVLTTKAGNCIDLTCLFASMIEAINMQPDIIIVPGHAFVGVHAWADSEISYAIETTMIGTSPFADAWDEGRRKMLEDFDSDTDTIISVKKCRGVGILPAPVD